MYVRSYRLDEEHVRVVHEEEAYQEWQRQIDSGEVESRAALARELGITRAHVTQMLRLLRLAPSVQETVLALGDPIVERQVGMHTLRDVPKLRCLSRSGGWRNWSKDLTKLRTTSKTK